LIFHAAFDHGFENRQRNGFRIAMEVDSEAVPATVRSVDLSELEVTRNTSNRHCISSLGPRKVRSLGKISPKSRTMTGDLARRTTEAAKQRFEHRIAVARGFVRNAVSNDAGKISPHWTNLNRRRYRFISQNFPSSCNSWDD
jgi:hypothetical protein